MKVENAIVALTVTEAEALFLAASNYTPAGRSYKRALAAQARAVCKIQNARRRAGHLHPITAPKHREIP